MSKRRSLGKWLPHVSRKWRIACNVFISLLPLVFIWVILGSPLPMMVEFRRIEQSALMGPSEVLAVVKGRELDTEEIPDEFWEYTSESLQKVIRSDLKKARIVVGDRDGYLVWMYDTGRGDPSGGIHTKTDTVNLWHIRSYVTSSTDGSGTEVRTLAAGVIAVQTELSEAHFARLDWKDWRGRDAVGYFSNHCQGAGTVQENGVFVIPVFQSCDPVPDDTGIDGRFDLCEAHLVLTDADGTVIYDEILIVE